MQMGQEVTDDIVYEKYYKRLTEAGHMYGDIEGPQATLL